MEALPAAANGPRPRMQDVAELAGVGLGTVSRVVNGRSEVSAETAARVRTAIEKLGFQRDEVARTLGTGQRSSSVAILLGDLTNPFYASIAHGAVQIAQKENFSLVVGTVDEDPEAECRAVRELIGRRIAGLVIVPDQGDHSFLHTDLPQATPVVFADRPAEGFEADVVLTENERGGYLATRHLIEHQHQHIGVLVAPSYYTTGLRLRGYRRALREAGHRPDTALVQRLHTGSAQEAERATDTLLALAEPPTALFTTTNFLSEGALRSIRKTGRTIALVGFDDFQCADLLPDPVTVVAVDAEEMGRTAMRLLLERIRGSSSAPRRIVFPVTLRQRGSGEIAVTRRRRVT